ncbi:MAG: aminotransferase class I/II-fold pyridoxal phosphate-dependent enzyme, partial [Patescibacteria group bacterium]|nr:aminotransferase class I/II-fold pyridoxal phosphate-dependent enzyme [Patescibacteria group bacterium]
FASLSQAAYRRTLTINAFSKTFAMTGWRLGYGAGPKELITAMANLQDQISSNPNTIAQKAGLVAWERAGDFPEKMRREFSLRRQLMVKKLNQIKGINAPLPDGAFYVWANISRLTQDDQVFCTKLLEDGGVALTPGTPFGAPGFIRLSFANSREQIKLGMDKLKSFVETYY